MASFKIPTYKAPKEDLVNDAVVRVIQSYFGSDREDKASRCYELAEKAHDIMEKDKEICHQCMDRVHKPLYDSLGLDYEKEMNFVRQHQRHSSSVEGLFWNISEYLAFDVDKNRDRKIEPKYDVEGMKESVSSAAEAIFDEAKTFWKKNGLDLSNLTLKCAEITSEQSRPYKAFDFIRFEMFVHYDDKVDYAERQYRILRNIADNHGILLRGYGRSSYLADSPDKRIYCEALAKDIRERSLFNHLKDSLKEHVINPSIRCFSDDDILKIQEYRDLFADKSDLSRRTNEIIVSVKEDAEVQGKPNQWFSDAIKEFDDIIQDKESERKISFGLHR